MLFNPILRALSLQASSVALMTDMMMSCESFRRTQLQCMQTILTLPQEQMAKLSVPTQSSAAFMRRTDLEMFRGNAASIMMQTTSMQIEAAENEGMGTAVSSTARSRMARKVPAYDASCNIDAAAMEKHEAVPDKPQSIRKWFSKNAVAEEQDIIDDRIPNRRVYSGIGQAPNAPSAIAVLERYKEKIRAV